MIIIKLSDNVRTCEVPPINFFSKQRMIYESVFVELDFSGFDMDLVFNYKFKKCDASMVMSFFRNNKIVQLFLG